MTVRLRFISGDKILFYKAFRVLRHDRVGFGWVLRVSADSGS
jgi:hypothetical protein